VDTENDIITSVESSGYKKYFSFEISEENKNEIIEEGRKLQNEGHNVVFEKTENIDISDFSNEFSFIDTYDHDITNRGISRTMSDINIVEKYLEIHEIPEDKYNLYRDEAINIINSSSEEL
jgi:hypothetical protein